MSKNKGNKFENKCKKHLASGGLWFEKGDLDYKDYCIEVKYTDKKSFSITAGILEKIWNEALAANKEPMIMIGIPKDDNNLFMIEGRIIVKRKQQ